MLKGQDAGHGRMAPLADAWARSGHDPAASDTRLPRPRPSARMGKRASGAAAAAAASAPAKRGKAKADAGLPGQASAAMAGARPWVHKLLQDLEVQFNEFESIDEYLEDLCGTNDKLAAMATQMAEAFPPLAGTQYSEACVPGPGIYRVHHFGFRPECGNSGLTPMEDAVALVTLVATQGFKTDPDVPGGEKIVVAPVEPAMFEDYEAYPQVQLPGEGIATGSLGQIKGWRRINAAWFVQTAAVRLNLVEELQTDERVYNSLRAVHATRPEAQTVEQQIFANRQAPALARGRGRGRGREREVGGRERET
jgi:hypothetical protein